MGYPLRDNGRCIVPGPAEVGPYLDIVLRIDNWSQRFPHRLFKDSFPSKERFVEFVRDLAEHGEVWFRGAVQAGVNAAMAESDRSRYDDRITKLPCDRDAVIGSLLTSVRGMEKFCEFKCQVLMRTIEMCIHQPFGNVRRVPTAWGGQHGAGCLVRSLEMAEGSAVQSLKLKEKKAKVPEWIVAYLNARTERILMGTDGTDKRHLNLELKVLGLVWDSSFRKLRHASGIGKVLDSSDGEHVCCMIHTLHQSTLPSRNISSRRRIDSCHTFPIRPPDGCGPAKDMAFMEPLVDWLRAVEEAYPALIMSPGYEHKALPDIFCIEMDDANDVDAETEGGGEESEESDDDGSHVSRSEDSGDASSDGGSEVSGEATRLWGAGSTNSSFDVGGDEEMSLETFESSPNFCRV
jgi:hypothetical protein